MGNRPSGAKARRLTVFFGTTEVLPFHGSHSCVQSQANGLQSFSQFRVWMHAEIEQRLHCAGSFAEGENDVDGCFNLYRLVIEQVRLVAPVAHGIDGGLP